MKTFKIRPLEKTLASIESEFYGVIRIDAAKQMSWNEYFLALSNQHSVTDQDYEIKEGTITVPENNQENNNNSSSSNNKLIVGGFYTHSNKSC